MTKTLKYKLSKQMNRTHKVRGGIGPTILNNKNDLPFMYFYNLRETEKTENEKKDEKKDEEKDEEKDDEEKY